MKKINFIIFVTLIFILEIFATYKVFLISNDKAFYETKNDTLFFKYITPKSNIYKSGIMIKDKLLYVNRIQIKNKHFLHNKVFDVVKPNTYVEYIIKSGEKLKTFQIKLERRFKIIEILFSLLIAIFFLLFSLTIYLSFPLTRTVKSLLGIFLSISLMSVFINVPFSNLFLYSLFIIICFISQFLLFIFTKNFLINYRYSFFSYLVLFLFSTSSLLWLFSYVKFTLSLNPEDHRSLTFFLKIFHVTTSINMIHSILFILIKIFKLYQKNAPKEYFITSFIFVFLLLLYPLFYTFPFVLRHHELIPFYFFFLFYLINLVLLIKFKQILIKVFL